MGEARKKKTRFLQTHPICCFCGGDTQATTVDHVPGRVCFWERAFPESFEFPACVKCQSASRLDELAFGFFAHMLDKNPKNFDSKNVNKIISGMANNLPHILPNPYLGGREKRKLLAEIGLKKPDSIFSSQIPLVTIDPAANDYILRYTRKIACALFYREQGRIAPSNYKAWVHWEQSSLPRAEETLKGFIDMTPLLVKGERSNLDFGDRFAYRYNKADQPDILAILALFGKGIVIAAIIAEPEFWSELNWSGDLVPVSDIFL
jgi:hypothetical protein